jgi:hypothetical protein
MIYFILGFLAFPLLLILLAVLLIYVIPFIKYLLEERCGCGFHNWKKIETIIEGDSNHPIAALFSRKKIKKCCQKCGKEKWTYEKN